MSFKSGFTTIALAALLACGAGAAQAQAADDDLRRKVEDLQKQIDELKAQLRQRPAAATTQAATPA